ncbi:MAG: sulfatase, partial [Bryobacteraceae bacterium]
MNLSRRSFLSLSAAAAFAPAATGRTPNVVLIYCDDLGYGDLGCYGSSIQTPNIDRLATEGTRFTSCISANPVCSPSRAALLTGRYPTRVGVPRVLFPKDTGGLDQGETTMANLLKQRSYKTKAIGKWHLGVTPQYLPTARGFDEYIGIPYSNDMNPPVLMRNNDVIAQEADQTQLTPRYTEEATSFIQNSGNNPFFLYLAHTYPHIPLHASPRFKGKSAQGLYGDVVQELDWSTGEILKTLEKTGVAKDTLVIFSSDNGPWYLGSPGRLRGRKGSTYEGGVREPLLMRYPGRIPAGRVSNALISMMDFFPTIAGLTGAKLPDRPLDGLNA